MEGLILLAVVGGTVGGGLWVGYKLSKPYMEHRRNVDEAARLGMSLADYHRMKVSGWHDRTVGTIDGHEVTFRQGYGNNEGHTLIADGQPSGRSFDQRREHNHYGPNREDDGYVNGDRGYYTGPGH